MGEDGPAPHMVAARKLSGRGERFERGRVYALNPAEGTRPAE